jgi:di/tricarboxylate transporter
MMQGPGGYAFGDFVALGLPPTIIIGITVLLPTLLLYPF